MNNQLYTFASFSFTLLFGFLVKYEQCKNYKLCLDVTLSLEFLVHVYIAEGNLVLHFAFHFFCCALFYYYYVSDDLKKN